MSGPSPVADVDRVREVLERELGVVATDVRRQTRWRPTWFVRGTRGSEQLDLVVRGERVDTRVLPLTHEMAFHAILLDHGIPVPQLHGYLPDLDAVVMDRVPGRPDFDDVPDSERDTVVDEYLQVMARVHALPVGPFDAAGILRARSPSEAGVVGHWHMEKIFRAAKCRPDPFMEFCLGWLHRNPPDSRGRETPVIWDTGQFHHDAGHLVAILDLEFGHVGDPMLDLAVWRMRDTLIPFGEFPRLYARYEELTGTPVDLVAVQRHHIGATIGNQLMFGPAVADPVPGTDLMNNMQWNSETNLHATEGLAEVLGVELPVVEVPEPRSTRRDKAFEHLVGTLRWLRTDDYLLQHDLRLAFRMARHLQRTNGIGDAVVEADLDDLAELLGSRPTTWEEGDQLLERFVLADAAVGRHDETLVRLFHRRNLRVHMQLGPAGSSMVRHLPTQSFA
jgi:aminoglycoside phosphotransferase (APT) family kinase protein